MNCNAKLLMLAFFHLMDDVGHVDSSLISKVRAMTKIKSDEKWSQAILDSLQAGCLMMDSADDGKTIFYVVRIPS